MTAIGYQTANQHATTTARPRLLIADDDPLVVAALDAQLGRDFDIIGFARDAEEAIALAKLHQPTVAIIDVQMPAGGGLHATGEIRKCAPNTAMVALSADETGPMVLAMLDAGAMAYLRKGAAGRELADVLRSAIIAHARLQ